MRRTLAWALLLSLAALPLSGCVWRHDDEHGPRYAPAPEYQGAEQHQERGMMAPPPQRFPGGEPHDQDDFDHH